jgi:hypothetical protein
MSSVPSPLDHNDQNESIKPKRLPRSAKKRLRYERIRQQRKQARKKKKTHTSSTHSSSIVLPSNSSESKFSRKILFQKYVFPLVLTDQTVSVTGKIFKRAANERLAEINRESIAPVICIDCAYNESMSGKVSSSHVFQDRQ